MKMAVNFLKKHKNIKKLLFVFGIIGLPIATITGFYNYFMLYFALCGAYILVRNRLIQNQYNKTTRKILENIRDGNSDQIVDYVLLLRSFEHDRFLQKRPWPIFQVFFGFNFLFADRAPHAHITTEALFVEQLGARYGAHVVTIGAPESQHEYFEGGGRIFLSENWLRDVEKLLEKAKAIIMLPGLSRGVQAEMDLIRNCSDILKKTIFVIPPKRVKSSSPKLNKTALTAAQNFLTLQRLPLTFPENVYSIFFRFVNKSVLIGTYDKDWPDGLVQRLIAMQDDMEGRIGLLAPGDKFDIPDAFIETDIWKKYDEKPLDVSFLGETFEIYQNFSDIEAISRQALSEDIALLLYFNSINILGEGAIYANILKNIISYDKHTEVAYIDLSGKEHKCLDHTQNPALYMLFGFLGWIVPSSYPFLYQEIEAFGRALLTTKGKHVCDAVELRNRLQRHILKNGPEEPFDLWKT